MWGITISNSVDTKILNKESEKVIGNNFINQAFYELQRVTWPSSMVVTKATILIIMIVVLITAYVGGLDFLFSKLIFQIKS